MEKALLFGADLGDDFSEEDEEEEGAAALMMLRVLVETGVVRGRWVW